MKKIIFILLLLPTLLFGQLTNGKIISNKPSGGIIIGDTMKVGALYLKQTTASQTIIIGTYTSGTNLVYIQNLGSVSVTLSPGGALAAGGMLIYRWNGVSWCASAAGSSSDNSKVNVSGDTMTGPLDMSGSYFRDVDNIKDASGVTDIDIANRHLVDASGNDISDYSSRTNGFGVQTNTHLGYLKTTNTTANRTLEFPDGSGTIARTSDIPAGTDSTLTLKKANNLADLPSKSTSRINLGVAIGTNVQAYNANLTKWAAYDTAVKVNTNYLAAQLALKQAASANLSKWSLLDTVYANTGRPGRLSQADWNTFNNKQVGSANLSKWSLLDTVYANTGRNGRLSLTDWNTFNNKASSASVSAKQDTGTAVLRSGTRAMTADWAIGGFKFTGLKSIAISGTSGNGYGEFIAQSSVPNAPSSTGFRLSAGSTGNFGWKQKNGTDTNRRAFSGTLTANRTYTLKDSDGTIAFTSDISAVSNLEAGFFGDGSEGDVTISGNTTLTADRYFHNLTVNSGVTVTTAGFRIFCTGTLTVNGSVVWNGNNGSNGSANTGGGQGAILLPASLGGAGAGTAGGTGVTGVGVQSTVIGTLDILGGNPGDGGAGGNGASGAGAAARTATVNNVRKMKFLNFNILFGITLLNGGGGGQGGGSGSGDGSIAGAGGGGGGGGGGIVMIVSDTITIGASGVITALGGNGGNGTNRGSGNTGGGGGGAGGGGGSIFLYYNKITNSGSISVSGGTGGTHGNATGTGTNGTDGVSGSTGVILKYNGILKTFE